MSSPNRTARKIVLSSVSRLRLMPFGGLLGPAASDAAQSIFALVVAAAASLGTGLLLASVSGVLNDYQGLLLLLPATIGLRGNVFGPFAGRISTAIQTGVFNWSLRSDSVLFQNLIATITASVVSSVVLGVMAKMIAEVTLSHSTNVMGLFEFVEVSAVSGALATVGLIAVTFALAWVSARYDWDLDNVTAPIVSAAGDLGTLLAVLFSVWLLDFPRLSMAMTVSTIAIGVGLIALLVLKRWVSARRIVIESMPILVLAGFVSLLAGIVLENALLSLSLYPVLLVLLPGYLTIAGSLGGILANRLSTKVHLGLVKPQAVPSDVVRSDVALTFRIAVPILLLLALCGQVLSFTVEGGGPPVTSLVASIVTAGVISTAFVALVAYYGTLLVVRFGLDPDNHGIPMVSASMDLVGSATLIGALILWGVI